jgi:hypothetical protein
MDESEAGFLAINWILTNLTVLKPFDISMLMGIFTVVALLIFSGLISGSEIAFFSIDPNQFKELEESEDKTDALIINHLENPK